MTTIKVTETILRDAHQSLIATRMTTEEMIPVLESLDAVGYHALECWGGATFDVSLRFLNENPWDRLRTIRKHVKNTKLQMLLRGQNLVGYRHYADDVVEAFVKHAIDCGIDIIRIFDALNDIRNIQKALEVTKREGGHAQAAISYTVSPAHTIDTYLSLAQQMAEMGADSICIKDMSGLLTPYAAGPLVRGIKEKTGLPVDIHSHYTSGFAAMTYMKAVEAGADIIDTAISPFAMGTSQPATETMAAAFEGSPYQVSLNRDALRSVTAYFSKIRERAAQKGLLDIRTLGVDADTLIYQVPGGMLSNLISQLKQQNAMDRFEDVLKEVPEVRKDLGYPPLVTPTSQMVGTQAVLNVLLGERYKIVPKEVKEYIKGMYGRPTVSISPEIVDKMIGQEPMILCRPADLIAPQLTDELRKQINEYIESDEDLITYALFPQNAENFFKFRQAKKYKVDSELVDMVLKTHPI
jgi:oxaloacetate decarboxylase alpha subunit